MQCDGARPDALQKSQPARATLLRPGQNCQRVARASRAAVLIDGDAYFRAFAQAALRATRSIVIVGWDFDSRTALHLEQPGIPDLLGEFLNFLADRRRSLEVSILIWDSPLMFSTGRELSPSYGLGWRPHPRVHFQYDDRCPRGASLHHKLVVIDAAVAFCGGLDLTRGRWDTSEHRPGDSRRTNTGENQLYAPFHDAMLAVEGECARALHELANERWRQATGRALPRNPLGRSPRSIWWRAAPDPREVWPVALTASFRDIDVAIARTVPAMNGRAPVSEVRNLYLDMIGAARRYIYLENQYFTANALGTALAARLGERDGPEIIAVLRLSSSDWIEARTMNVLRSVLLRKLRQADRYGRFHAYYPFIPGSVDESSCDVHTKLMVVDDTWLRLGSANFASRSMWLDTECDLLVEANGGAHVRTAIADVRDRFLCEHLDTSREAVRDTVRSTGSLSGAIQRLARSEGRTLKPFDQLDAPSETLVAAAAVADPEPSAPPDGQMASSASRIRDSYSGSGRTGVARLLRTLVAALVRRLRPASNRYGTGRS